MATAAPFIPALRRDTGDWITMGVSPDLNCDERPDDVTVNPITRKPNVTAYFDKAYLILRMFSLTFAAAWVAPPEPLVRTIPKPGPIGCWSN